MTSFAVPGRRGTLRGMGRAALLSRGPLHRLRTAALHGRGSDLSRIAASLGRGSDLSRIAASLRRDSGLLTIRSVGRELRRTPFATSLAAALLATTIVVRHVVSEDQDVLRWASTNLENLTTRPLRSMLFSAVLLPGGRWLPYAGAIAAVVVPLERRVGAVRVLTVFASGHVIATLLTEGGVALGIQAGLVPAGASDQLDVGASYGLGAVGGAALLLLPRRWRTALAAAAGAAAAVLVLTEQDHMTAAGHAVSLAVGIASWPHLRRSLGAGTTRAR